MSGDFPGVIRNFPGHDFPGIIFSGIGFHQVILRPCNSGDLFQEMQETGADSASRLPRSQLKAGTAETKKSPRRARALLVRRELFQEEIVLENIILEEIIPEEAVPEEGVSEIPEQFQ